MNETGIITFFGAITVLMMLFASMLGYGKKLHKEEEAKKESLNESSSRRYISNQMRRC